MRYLIGEGNLFSRSFMDCHFGAGLSEMIREDRSELCNLLGPGIRHVVALTDIVIEKVVCLIIHEGLVAILYVFSRFHRS